MKPIMALVLALLFLSCGTTNPRPAASRPDAKAAAALEAIADEVWARQLEQDVITRVESGLPVETLPDPSHARAERDAGFARDVLARLEKIDAAALSEDDRLTLEILRWQHQMAIDVLAHFWHVFPVTPYVSPVFAANQALAVHTFEKPEDGERYLRLLGDYERFLDALGDVVQEQRRRGILIPKPELPLVRGMFSSLLRDSEAFAVADSRLSGMSAGQRAAFSAAVKKVICETINPALQRLLDRVGADYEQAAPATVGLWQYPGGAAAYRSLIRLQTSLDMEPDEIHRFGLSEVERLERELDGIRREVGFDGSLAEFYHFLETDARFFARSSEEIGERLTRYIAKIEPQIPRFFARLPRAPYEVRRLAPALEGSMTFGYYQVPTPADPIGHYLYNGSKPTERSLLTAASLMAHELLPGHHFQFNRQEENESLHPFRRQRSDNVFAEGWGEYSGALGKEMGLYTDPYDRAGRIMVDLMMSSRLVVDTGMNALEWPRERAMQFLRDHTLLSETEIATETLRYSVDIPAQALAYKLGSARMLALRERVQRELGPRFDIRTFHEWMIGSGSMPLPLLEQHVEVEMRLAAPESTRKY
jgi:uncharacterized protein (DUF885 family)